MDLTNFKYPDSVFVCVEESDLVPDGQVLMLCETVDDVLLGEDDTAVVAVYKFDRMVKVTHKLQIEEVKHE